MNTNIGTAQQSVSLTSNATVSQQIYYFTRFVSEQLLNISSITAQTWTFSCGMNSPSVNSNFPADGNGVNPCRIVAYVWRPGTGKVGDIIDGNSSNNITEPGGTQRNILCNFSGAAVSGIQNGDVICYEAIFAITQASATAYALSVCYDGTTVSSTNGQSTTNQASYIETPQNLTFGTPPTSITCTPTSKSIYNKTTKHG
jgi:hypothetical protein